MAGERCRPALPADRLVWTGAMAHSPPSTAFTQHPARQAAHGTRSINLAGSRYLRLIDEVEAAYAERRLSTRQAHQKLSYLLRRFVYEVRGHRADTLTLADLMQTRYHQLAAAVQRYYLPEFARLEHGDTAEALRIAREVISTWH